MEYIAEVREHESHSKKGKREEVRAHGMRVNPAVHTRHLRKLHEEAEALDELARGRARKHLVKV